MEMQASVYVELHLSHKSYDAIKGYQADDSYFSAASAFLNNTISLARLERAMVLGKLGEQIIAAFAHPRSGVWQEQCDLGVRYLSEGNYEEAIQGIRN